MTNDKVAKDANEWWLDSRPRLIWWKSKNNKIGKLTNKNGDECKNYGVHKQIWITKIGNSIIYFNSISHNGRKKPAYE